MGRYMRLWVYAICCRYQTRLYTSCGVWNTGGSTSITTNLSLQPLQKEKCWRILNRSAVGQSHKCSTKTYVCQYKLLFWQENLSDAVMSKVCQNVTMGDFSFYITTGFTPIKERSHFKTSKGSPELVKRMNFQKRVKRPLLYPVSLLFGCWDTEIQISRTKII